MPPRRALLAPLAAALMLAPVPPRAQPETEAAKRLAPIAHPALPTPADRLPTGRIRLPNGFRVEVFASGIADARTLREGDRAPSSSAPAGPERSMRWSAARGGAR